MWIFVELSVVFVAIASSGLIFGPKLSQYGLAKAVAGLFAIAAFALTFVVPIFRSSTELPVTLQEPKAEVDKNVETIDQSEAENLARIERKKLQETQKIEAELAQEQETQKNAAEALRKEEVRMVTCQGEIEALIGLSYMYSDQYKSLSQQIVLERFYVDGGNGNGFDFLGAEKQNCESAASALEFAQKAIERYDGCRPFSLQNEPVMGTIQREHAFYKEIMTACIAKWN